MYTFLIVISIRHISTHGVPSMTDMAEEIKPIKSKSGKVVIDGLTFSDTRWALVNVGQWPEICVFQF
jgi:hypothetical protein